MAKHKYIETPEVNWCNIKNCEGYMISNFGDIISFRKRNSKEFYTNPKLIKQGIVKTHCNKQYSRVKIIGKSYYVHRLVAEHFIENKLNKPQVNHIDGNSLNNCIINLEWVSNSENQIHRFKINGTKHNYGQYVHKSKNNFRVYKKGVVDKSFKELQTAQEFAKQYY